MDGASLTTGNLRLADGIHGGGDEDEGAEEECCDAEAWETLSKSFKEVQSILDHNRRLIEQVNDNQRSLVPMNLAKNVGLICEINGNISRVIALYSNLSADFSNVVQLRRANKATKDAVVWKNSSS